jgi:hypothetical protein
MRLAARAQAIAAQAERLTTYVGTMMTLAGVTKHQGERFTASLVQNPPKVTALLADAPALRADVDALPEPLRGCVKVTPPTPEAYQWDKRAILALAKTDPELVAPIARIERDERLAIK